MLRRDPALDGSFFSGGFHSRFIIIVPVSGTPSFLGLGGCVLLRLVLVGFVSIDMSEEILCKFLGLGYILFPIFFVQVLFMIQ